MVAAIGLRAELERLEAQGRLLRVQEEVSPQFEVAAIASQSPDDCALLFENVVGSSHAIAMNSTAGREVICASLDVKTSDFAEAYLKALMEPIDPVLSDSKAPLSQEIVFRGDDINLLEQLPFLTHHEFDGGPYITSGVAIGEYEGTRNLSYHRMQVRSARETGFVVVQRHLHRMLEAADAANEPFPVAVVIGLDAATLLAAATSGSATPYGFDEFSIVGALRGQPVELVPALTIPVCVPTCSEIVLEGHVLPNRFEEEGPFAEFAGRYQSGPRRVFRATALTMRRNAIYQGLSTASTSQLNIMGLPNEAVILRSVRSVVPSVQKVHVTLGGLRKFHAVISVKKTIEADPADAIVAAFAGHRDLKQVTIVDDDVDVFSADQVEKAMATSFQAHRDLHVFHRGRGNPVDTSRADDGTTSRVGFDATRPLSSDKPELASIPGIAESRLKLQRATRANQP